MNTSYFESCQWIWALWIVSATCTAGFTTVCLRQLRWHHVKRVCLDEDGAGYTLSYVFTIPIYILMLAVVLESTFLLMAKLGTVYAAFAGARSAIVWYPSAHEAVAEEKARKAATRAFVPFASGAASAKTDAAVDESDMDAYLEAYQEYLATVGFDKPAPKRYVRAKYRYAHAPDVLDVQLEVRPIEGGEVWEEDIICTVTYNFPFSAPIIDRLMGQPSPNGYIYPITSRVVLQSETPMNEEKRLGISYASPELIYAPCCQRSCWANRLSPTRTTACRHAGPSRSLLVAEEGKISLVSSITVLAFLVLIGLVTNSGVAVNEKIEAQNAADAAAYSTSLWMARGMNAVTTTNHLMGELTALMVIIESLGGPELEEPKARENEEINSMNAKIESPWIASGDNDQLDKAISFLKDLGGNGPVQLYTATGSAAQTTRLAKLDQEFVKLVQELTVTGPLGDHKAGGAIYDAQLTLKYWIAYGFKLKFVINLAYGAVSVLTFGTFEPAASALGCVAHGVVDVGVAWVCKDWILMKGVELFATAMQAIKKAAPYAIMAISLYGDSVSKRGRLAEPITIALKQLGDDLNSELAIYPAPRDIKLPVVAEAPPADGEFQSETVPPSKWIGEEWDDKDGAGKYWLVDTITWPERELDKKIEEANRWLKKFDVWVRNPFSGKRVLVFSFPKIPEVETVKDFAGFPQPPQRLDDKLPSIKPGGHGYPENFSLDEERLPKLNWEQERKSQWVRATYPYVESWRSGFNELFFNYMGMSNAWTYYTNWTNRYTIVISHDLRSEGPDLSLEEIQRVLEPIREKVAELRAQFDDAILGSEESVGDSAEPENGDDPFELVKNELLDYVKGGVSSNGLSGPLKKLVDDWLSNVTEELDAGGLVDQASEEAEWDDSVDIDEQDFRLLVYELTLIETLDELLRFFEERLDFEVAPPHMYVMIDMVPEEKGDEPWTGDDQLAEELFTVVASAKRKQPHPVFRDKVYRDPNRHGISAFAQSMVYNANSRQVKHTSKDTQPPTGWDTLNWTPNRNGQVRAPEWGGVKPRFRGAGKLPSLFLGRRPADDHCQVRLNWQAKLVSLSEPRVEELAADQIQAVFQQAEINH